MRVLELRLVLFIGAILGIIPASNGQGCVAVRNLGLGATGITNEPKTWTISTNYRFFHSYKHFVGSERQTHREKEHTNVINNDHSLILGANYWITSKWGVSASVPLIYIHRSSLYEHYGNASGQRFSTSSKGLGDVRIQTNYLFVDKSSVKLLGGIGLKLPTGNYNYKDYFHKMDKNGNDSLALRVVDQSIQPGDGGWGVFTSMDGVVNMSPRVSLYWSGMYLSNPGNTNGIKRSSSLTNDADGNPIPRSNEFSIGDQFFGRVGARYNLPNSSYASLGIRMEGVPSKDLIGKEDGFRRPGYILSADPSVVYVNGNHTFGLNIPIALYRERTRSHIDILRGNDANGPVHGDAAFADFLVSFSYTLRLAKKSASPFGESKEVIGK